MSTELLPCPFCGSGQTSIKENGKVWTGMRWSEPSSVSVQHDPVRSALQALVESVAPLVERDLCFFGAEARLKFDSHSEALEAIGVARDLFRGARKALAASRSVPEHEQARQGVSHEAQPDVPKAASLAPRAEALPPLPEPDHNQQVGYDAMRYVDIWPTSYLKEYARAYALSAIESAIRPSAEPLPAIKGAWIDGGYVIVTPAGSGSDKAPAVKAAILRMFPVTPRAEPKDKP